MGHYQLAGFDRVVNNSDTNYTSQCNSEFKGHSSLRPLNVNQTERNIHKCQSRKALSSYSSRTLKLVVIYILRQSVANKERV